MKVIRAKVLGFCMGVRRAVRMAEAELAAHSGSPVYSLGPLIHNPQTLASLEKRGLVILDEARAARTHCTPDCTDKAVIIRAHGISPAVEASLKKNGFRITDATCPRVKASQTEARALAEKGYVVFIAGEKDHAEVKGVAGYVEAGGGKAVIGNSAGETEEAARALYRENPRVQTALIAQTTLSPGEYRAAAETLQKVFPAVEIRQTICGATRERQDALRELCAVCDIVVVAGGKESANTKRLFAIAGECGKPCFLAETAGDLPRDLGLAAGGASVAGLCAGASTPDEVIDEIEAFLKSARE